MKHLSLFSWMTIALALVAASMWIYWATCWQFEESTDNAYVVGHTYSISPLIEGNAKKIWLEENQYVEKGQILLEMDTVDMELKLQNQKVALTLSAREAYRKQQIALQSMCQVEIEQKTLQNSKAQWERRKQLALSNSISQEEAEEMQTKYVQSQYALQQAKSQLQSAEMLANFLQQEIKLHPDVQAAIIGLKQAYTEYCRCYVYAPHDGFIAKKQVEIGDRIFPQTPIYSIASLSDVWIEANFKETQISNLCIGQSVEITADLYGDKISYQGIIDSISIAAGNVFSLLPAQNATGNWIKVVQRIPVKIKIPQEQLKEHPLFLGASAKVCVKTKDRTGVKLLSQPIPNRVENSGAYEEQIPWEIIHQEIDACIACALLP